MAKQSFSGSAFYPSLGEEIAKGTISFNMVSLFFFAESGKIEIPLNRLQIRVDKMSGRIFLTDSKKSAGNIFTDESEIFEHRAFTHVPELRKQIIELSGAKNAGIKLIVATGIFSAVFLLMAIAIFWSGGFALRYLVNKVPTTYESDIGDQLVAKLKARRLLTEKPKDTEFLQAMGKRLLPKDARSKFKFEFHVVPIAQPNAFAVPGGKIFITEGALNLLSREELTGVLAHELTHVVKRHALRQVISFVGTYAAMRLLVKGDTAFQSAINEASDKLFTSGFSQGLENEADDGGWNYLVAANIDPRSLANALRKLGAQYAKKDPDAPPEVFSTHPLTSTRLKRLDKKWSELKTKTGFVDFAKAFPEKSKQ